MPNRVLLGAYITGNRWASTTRGGGSLEVIYAHCGSNGCPHSTGSPFSSVALAPMFRRLSPSLVLLGAVRYRQPIFLSSHSPGANSLIIRHRLNGVNSPQPGHFQASGRHLGALTLVQVQINLSN